MHKNYRITAKTIPGDVFERVSRVHAAGLQAMASKKSVGVSEAPESGEPLPSVKDIPESKNI